MNISFKETRELQQAFDDLLLVMVNLEVIGDFSKAKLRDSQSKIPDLKSTARETLNLIHNHTNSMKKLLPILHGILEDGVPSNAYQGRTSSNVNFFFKI